MCSSDLASASRRRPHRAWGFAGIALLGVYEGFFGPGTGMFIVFLFVRLMGMEFLSAAAHARVVKLGHALLALKELEYFGEAFDGPVPERLTRLLEAWARAETDLRL